MNQEIYAQVRETTADVLSVDADKITAESSFVNDLGADSLDLVDLVMQFEQDFETEITDAEAEKLQTVADAVALIEAKTS